MRIWNILCLSVIIAFFAPLCVFSQSNTTETLSITTYYPAPYGVYGILKLNPRSKPAEPCQEGEMTYDNSTTTNRGLYYCNSTSNWAKISGDGGGAGGSFWLENTTTHNIYNNNTGGRVGIGTQNPQSKLAVYGGALGSTAGNIIELQEIDSSVSDNQQLRTFTRRTAAGNTWTTAELIQQRRINGADLGFIIWPAGKADIGFGSGANEYMRINGTTGNVGIGTTTPAYKLQVEGNIRVNSGGITVSGDVCNDAGHCLKDIPPCPNCPVPITSTCTTLYRWDAQTAFGLSSTTGGLQCQYQGTSYQLPTVWTNTSSAPCVTVGNNCPPTYPQYTSMPLVCYSGPSGTATICQ